MVFGLEYVSIFFLFHHKLQTTKSNQTFCSSQRRTYLFVSGYCCHQFGQSLSSTMKKKIVRLMPFSRESFRLAVSVEYSPDAWVRHCFSFFQPDFEFCDVYQLFFFFIEFRTSLCQMTGYKIISICSIV